MAQVDWGDIEKGRGAGGNSKFLKMPEGQHQVRLVGKAFMYYKHWDPILAVCPGKDGGCPMCNSGTLARMRYAVNAIDRRDGQLKILDAGTQLFEDFRVYFDTTKIDPGSKEGPDFIVKVEVPGGDKRRTKYKAIALQPTPFTEQEAAQIREKGLFKLGEIFEPKSIQEIQAMMSGQVTPSGDNQARFSLPLPAVCSSATITVPSAAPWHTSCRAMSIVEVRLG